MHIVLKYLLICFFIFNKISVDKIFMINTRNDTDKFLKYKSLKLNLVLLLSYDINVWKLFIGGHNDDWNYF